MKENASGVVSVCVVLVNIAETPPTVSVVLTDVLSVLAATCRTHRDAPLPTWVLLEETKGPEQLPTLNSPPL